MRLFNILLIALLVALPAAGQVSPPGVPVTATLGPSGNFQWLSAGTYSFPSDANFTPTFPNTGCLVCKITSITPFTATRNLVLPGPSVSGGPIQRMTYNITNATTGGQAIQVIASSGTGVTIANGASKWVAFDGTNYVEIDPPNSSLWSALTNPTASLALAMAGYGTTFTYGAATGASDLMKWTDTASNTGNGILGHFTTASGSGEVPFQADANGVGFKMTPTGQLSAVGGTVNGYINMQSLGVLPAAPGSNTLQLTVPNSLTSYQLELPGAQPTSGNTLLSCTAASPSVCTWTAPSFASLLAANNTWTGTNAFNNTISAYKYSGEFGTIYGTIILGSGTGATIEKTVNDSSPTLVVSENTATTGTGDFIDAKDSVGTLHTILDHSLGLHGSVNGVTLTTGGSSSQFLNGAGAYVTPPYPTALPSLTINPTGTATPSNNYGSGCLTFLASFYDLGPTPNSWCMTQSIGTGSTPQSILAIAPVAGGTTGSHLFQVSADESVLQNGSSRVDITGSDAFLGIGGVGIDVNNSGNVVIDAGSSTGNIDLYPGTSGTVIANRPISAPTFSGISVGSQVNLNAPGGGSGVFNQNLTAENGDLHPCPTGTPTVAPGPAAGTGAGASLLGTNCAGIVTVNTGSSPAAAPSVIFTLTFANNFTHYGFCTFNALRVTLQDGGYNIADVYPDTGYADHFNLTTTGTMTLSGLSNHQWSYVCGGY